MQDWPPGRLCQVNKDPRKRGKGWSQDRLRNPGGRADRRAAALLCSCPGQEVPGHHAGRSVYTTESADTTYQGFLHQGAAYSSPRVGRHGASVGSEWLDPPSPPLPTPAAKRPTLSLEQLL